MSCLLHQGNSQLGFCKPHTAPHNNDHFFARALSADLKTSKHHCLENVQTSLPFFALQVLSYISHHRQAAESSGNVSCSHLGSNSMSLWESQAVLMLWLSILVLTPFDLIILDSQVTTGESNMQATRQVSSSILCMQQTLTGHVSLSVLCWIALQHSERGMLF
jgi:hypothetical protein